MAANIACIAVDWGTSNRRAWALGEGGAVLAAKADDQGLLAIKDRAFAQSLRAFAGDWLQGGAPIVMAGMVGSRAGWREAQYLETPVDLTRIGGRLTEITDFTGNAVRIVPGAARNEANGADVMRGEECQMLGALLTRGQRDGVFLLPGTHAKWAILKDGILTDFRTYMTGELFAHLRKGGSLSQVMPGPEEKDVFDGAAFDRGFAAGFATDAPVITHLLFTVRSLSLFARLAPAEAPSYLSGLLIGAEMKDALGWLKVHNAGTTVTAIGSAKLLETYDRAARHGGLSLDRVESDDILPPALFAIAREAGLIRQADGVA
ncbi:2-dehydro-3-deoxygalactonokinase [Dongia rigui]|uniref:2-dehydro-3-deoxygalactonokinase n=1 Tax=Dongia rigui TaxID=940149 RepID=A0ABU5DYG6_9PROT|nr:2-dehydro-3-deoxygalactonokinase [Dongia rigui]MDY0872367.1 2-dehydro-3-deoxygalactonokinase [Dongia rigui]